MKLVFLNTPMGTFTPTNSGAIATIIWELCRQAQAEGVEPVVVSRSSEVAPYRNVRTIFVDYPKQPRGGVKLLASRCERKVLGWTHLRQAEWAKRVAGAFAENGLLEHRVVMFNDPEMAVYLRRRFPHLFLLHWFQNQLTCKARGRSGLRQSANVVAGVSDFTSRWVQDYYGLGAGSVRTLYNAVDVERFTPAERMADGPAVINFVGRTGIEKAPDLLLKAAILLAKRTKDFALQIVGANHWGQVEMDAYQQQLQALSGELGAAGISVRFTGHVDRASLPGEIRKAHIHVVPSRWDEPFGLTTLEGMACGLATVGSRTGGTPEVIREAGLLFERESAQELAEKLGRLVADPAERLEMGRRCRERAQQFTWKRTWETLRKLVAD